MKLLAIMTQAKVSVNSSLKAIRIRGQWKAFCRQRIPGPRRTSKEIVDIDILITSRKYRYRNF